MATALAIPRDLSLKRYFFRSVFFHGLLIAAVFGAAYFNHPGADWGGVGSKASGGAKVNLVSSAGIPMPPKEAVTESKVVDPTESLHKEDPKPKAPEPKTDATPIQKFEKEKPLPRSPKSRIIEDTRPETDNAIPGHNGSPKLPTSYSQTPGPSGASQGVTAIGQGGGDFGGKYPWYVDGMRSRITQSWDQSTITAAVRAAHKAHTVMTFRINANGKISNMRMVQSSGDWSMDNSAQRALATILSEGSQFRPLPNDYMGSYIEVTFDFDLSLTQ